MGAFSCLALIVKRLCISFIIIGCGGVIVILKITSTTDPKGVQEMTNAQIIDLAKNANGITEDAHTFAHWKTLGYCVRKGEHAAFSCNIWKTATRKRNGVEVVAVDDEDKPVMFMKRAHFFTRSQVDAMAVA